MKDELQGKLVEILTSIQAAAGKASDFAMDQLPDIAQSYVAYGRVSETLLLLALVAMFGASLYCAFRWGFLRTGAVHEGGYSQGDWLETRIAAAVIGMIAAVVSLPLLLMQMNATAFVWLAPKVWLLKQLASMLK